MRDCARVAATFAFSCLAIGAQHANAALPAHPTVHTFEPTAEEIASMGSFPEIRTGTSVAIRNETALVGMPGLRKVAIFKRQTSGWTRTGSIAAPDASTNFGQTIAYRDNTVVVTADSAAYVFKLVNGVWKYTQKLIAESASISFGVLTFQDNMVVAGSVAPNLPGAVYVFELTSAGKLVRRLKLQSSDSLP
ncbi:MAG TPA: hypothetical protein VNA21_12725, partial [Steroidobacteraceae bacterium]|nr:hypothetical protein [Steroidobacteraceae bacterium]